MILPKDADIPAFAQEIVEQCFNSYGDRSTNYNLFRNLFLTGNKDGGEATFNRVWSDLDYLTSFLFSGETVVFEIDHDGKEPRHDFMARELAKRIKQKWSDNSADVLIYDLITWALTYGSMFIKVLPEADYVVDPYDIGVYREDITSLDDQEAFVHRSYRTKHEFRRMLSFLVANDKLSMEKAKEYYDTVPTVGLSGDSETLPTSIQNLIISNTTPNIQGSFTTPVQLKRTSLVAPYVDMDKIIKQYEVYVWDDHARWDEVNKEWIADYRIILMFEPQIVVWNHPNWYLAKDHPFVQFCPNRIYNYFFGISEIEKMKVLQEKNEKRINDIYSMLARQADPPVGSYGTSMIPLELKQAIRSPGGHIPFNNPQGKLSPMETPIPPDLWKDIDQNQQFRSELMGLPPIMKGYGERGVRSQAQVSKLASLGSSRVKKSALLIEDSLEKYATLRAKLLQKYDKTPMSYQDDKGERVKFLAQQFDPAYTVKVSAHSSSPVFVDQLNEKAVLLFDKGIIDGEMLAEILQFPNQNRIRERAKMMAAKQAQAEKEEKEFRIAELKKKTPNGG